MTVAEVRGTSTHSSSSPMTEVSVSVEIEIVVAIAIAELRAAEGGGSLRGTMQQPITTLRFRRGGQAILLLLDIQTSTTVCD